MTKKRLNIEFRRGCVRSTILVGGKITFDQIVSDTGYSRNEVAHHLALLMKRNGICKTDSEDGNMYSVRESFDSPRIMRSLNEFMHGCENPIHIFGIGYVDPASFYGKSLDP
jgi:DNA-binding transcriptional ArsR family regulator